MESLAMLRICTASSFSATRRTACSRIWLCGTKSLALVTYHIVVVGDVARMAMWMSMLLPLASTTLYTAQGNLKMWWLLVVLPVRFSYFSELRYSKSMRIVSASSQTSFTSFGVPSWLPKLELCTNAGWYTSKALRSASLKDPWSSTSKLMSGLFFLRASSMSGQVRSRGAVSSSAAVAKRFHQTMPSRSAHAPTALTSDDGESLSPTQSPWYGHCRQPLRSALPVDRRAPRCGQASGCALTTPW
mmetsp:Transcript_28442/g.91055  ORF Transcript_28442/g.91055 Transcript_28442/m.91055 type:complete len:245 (+) Transcript_28442:1418-2152(+)